MFKSWNKEESSISDKMRGMLKPDEPLKNKIQVAQKELGNKIDKLEDVRIKLKKKADLYFAKIVQAHKNNDPVSAHAYANELAHVRKVSNMMSTAKLSLERVQVRLETVSEFGDLVVTLSPCMAVIKNLGPSLGGMMPAASASMQDLSSMLGDIMSNSSVQDQNMLVDNGIDADTRAILDEAQNVVATKTNSTIPDIPDSLKHQIIAEKRDVLI